MPIVKRINKYQGLKDIDVLIEDTGVSSKYFQIYDFPSQLPQGKSSFLIAGSPFLKDNVELRIEIVDSAGNTVYTEPVPGYLEGRARRVSIEIYDDVEPGDGKMYIVGELKPNYKSYSAVSENQDEVTGNIGITNEFIDSSMGSNDVPSEYQGVYNVRYERDILINTKLPNSQPVFFYKQPSITAVEIVKPFIENSAPPADVVITGSIKVDPNPDIELPIILPPPPEPSPLPMPDVVDISNVGQFIERFKSSRKAKINPFQNQSFFARGRAQRRSSPEVDRFSIEIESMEQGSENDGDKASGAMIGGTIRINAPVVDTTRYPSSKFTIPTSYVSKVKKVKNNKILIPEDDFLITDKFTKERIPVKIITDTTGGGGTGGNSAAVTMSYSPTPTASLSTTHFRSFAKITTSGLRTFSGDVFKAKVFAKSQGALGEFEPYWEGPIESPQLLTDPFSDTGFVNVGYFHKKDVFEEHWVSGSNTTITRDDEKIIDAIQISGSNYTDGSNLTFTTSGSVELETNVPYTLQFNSYFYKELAEDKEGNDVTDFDCEVQVCKAALYDGGSVDEYQTLGKLDIDNFKGDTQGELSEVITTFVSPSSGDPKLKVRFKVNRGRLILSDVVARPYSETNFNPDFFQCIIPLPYPLPKRPDKYDFLVEFYDINNNLAETFALLEGVDFVGPAPVIADGLDALFSGSMLIGESMEMYGVNPAYLRTVGYRGFKHSIDNNLGGFLMFSGSIDSRISASEESGNEYNGGVGLEVVDGGGDIDRYMRFRTQPSIFEVVTDTFFLGRENLSFISGSLGNIEIFSSGTTTLTGSAVNILTPNFYFGGDEAFISGSGGELEISSSNFHLSSSGDVTMAGTITANAGSIGGFDITSDSLSSTNFFLSGSATGNKGKDDTNLFISSSGFAVTADGDLTGSKVLLTGGKIAGWTIEGTTLVGANATLDGQGSALFRTDAGPGSDSSAAFDQLRDEYYIDFTPTEGPTNSAGQFYVKFGPNFSIDNEGILFASGAKFAGTITASAGLIGGFQIGSSSLFAGTNEAAPNFFISGAAAGTDFTKSNLFISASGFQVNSQGVISASAGNIANFTIDNHSLTTTGVEINDSTQDLFISSSAFKVKHDGTISGSEVLFTGGKIGGFSITDTAISSSRLVMSDVGGNNTRIQVFRDSGNTEVIRLGEISDDSSDEHGLKLFDTDGTTEIVRLGQIGNKIGGWEITDSQIRTIPDSGFGGLYAEAETGLIIKSSGTLETSDFATGLKGWRISSEGNGTAEFENARIRGTLRTAVFEKESVNVVGGQLMIANSTTTQPLRNSSGSLVLSTGPAASSSIGVAEVTMSMANVTGFTSGSIIKAKKVDDTGFAVEYLHVEGSQRFTEAGSPVSASLSTARTNGFMDAVDPDGLAGFVFVSRGYGGAVAVSSSLSITNSGALNSSATQFNVSDASSLNLQDIIKIDTERMKVTKINSNTIDVVRDYHDTTAASHDTGTTIFRVDTDKEFLSGLVSTAQTYNEGQVFVDTGKFVPEDDISSGYILQNANPNDISTPYMDIVERTGSGVYDLQLRTRIGDLSGLSSGYLFGDEEPGFGIYTEKGFFKGSITADTGSFAGIVHIATEAGGLETGQKISMGRDVKGDLDGIQLNNNNYWLTTGEFRLGDSTNFLHISGTEASVASDLTINTDNFDLDVNGAMRISGSTGTARIALGSTPPQAFSAGQGFFVDEDGNFRLGGSAGSGGTITYNASSGLLSIDGTINITGGDLAGVDANSISGSTVLPDGILSGSAQIAEEISGSITATSASLSSDLDGTNTTLTNLNTTVTNNSSSISERIMTNASGLLFATPSPGSLTGLIMNGTHLGYASSGTFQSFIGSDGSFQFKGADANQLISFDGSTGNLVIKSRETFLSGSSVQVLTDKFFLGKDGQFISGSNGNIEINSQNIDISTNKLRISGSGDTARIALGSTPPQKFDAGQGFFVDESGNFRLGGSAGSGGTITYNASSGLLSIAGTVNITGGDLEGVNAASISGSTVLPDGILSGSDQIKDDISGSLGSNADLIRGLDAASISGSSTAVSASISERIMTNANGLIFATPSPAGLTGLIQNGTHLGYASSGTFQSFIGSDGSFQFKGADANQLVSFDGSTGNLVIKSRETFLSGSSVQVLTDKFFLGKDGQFISGSNGNIEINTNNFELLSSQLTASSDDSFISLGSETDRTEWTGSEGVWLSGSGEFNLQSGSQFIRNVTVDGGMEMNFGNFSVNSLGNLTAESGSFRGEVRAESGFFGTQTAGWQIDSNNLRDVDSIINLTPGSGDANVTASISLTNLDGDFRAEIVPEYSSADVVLNAGGFAYANGSQTTSTTATGGSTGISFPIGNGVTDSYTGNNVYGYYSTTTGDTAGSSFTVEKRSGVPAGSELTSGTEYKTTFKTQTVITMNTSLHASDNYYIMGTGTATITGKFKSDSGDIQSFTHTHNIHVDEEAPNSDSTDTTLTRTFTVASHTPSSTESHWVEIESFTITNTNLQQHFSIGPKNNAQQLNISAATATITEINHSPSNKITQIAPKGFQTINLGNSDLENDANTYVRTDVAGSKILDVLGDSFMTGSLTIKERGSTDVVTINPKANGTSTGGHLEATYIRAGNGSTSAPGLQLNSQADGFFHDTSINGIGVQVNSQYDFLFKNGGDFHADADLVGFSSTISDIQFKENVNPIQDALFKVQQLRGVEFDWKNEYSDKGHDIGFIAQEVESIEGLEPFVSEKLSLRANKSSKVVHYDKVVSLLVEAVKEQQIQIDDMKSEIEDLKNGNHD